MTQRPDRARIRTHGRYKVSVPLSASITRDDKPMRFSGTVVQFGPGGITAEVNADFDGGDILAIDFTLPYSQIPLRNLRHRAQPQRPPLRTRIPGPHARSALRHPAPLRHPRPPKASCPTFFRTPLRPLRPCFQNPGTFIPRTHSENGQRGGNLDATRNSTTQSISK